MNTFTLPPGIRALRPGHAPSCSSAGSVVGVALVSGVAWAALVTAFVRRLDARAPRGDDEAVKPPDAADPEAGTVDTRTGQARARFPPRLRKRREHNGAVLALAADEEGAGGLVFLDSEGAAAPDYAEVVGGPPPADPATPTAPNEVHLAVTSACPVRCTGCYTGASPGGRLTDPAGLRATLAELARLGAFEVAFGGGDPGLGAEVIALAREARRHGLVPNLTTSGFGVTPANAAECAGIFGQIHLSIDGLGPIYREVRGWDGAALGLGALRTLASAGVRVGVNTVLTQPLLGTPGALESLAETIREAGASEWSWLRFKPAGRGRESWDRLAPPAAMLDTLWPRLLEAEAATGLQIRIDCALVPFVATRVPVDRLVALGVYGCEGGRTMWARGHDTRWAPCSFRLEPNLSTAVPEAPESDPLALADQALGEQWEADEELQRWRTMRPRGACEGCAAWQVCRGGCRVVADFLTGDRFAPDPECPRVRAYGTPP